MASRRHGPAPRLSRRDGESRDTPSRISGVRGRRVLFASSLTESAGARRARKHRRINGRNSNGAEDFSAGPSLAF